MNKARRKRIAIVLDKLRVANEELTAIRDEEQDAYDNLPENIQTGLRGDDMQEKIYALDNAAEGLENIIGDLRDMEN